MIHYKKWDIETVASLAEDDHITTRPDATAIFLNRQNALQYMVRLTSKVPDAFPNHKLFTGYVKDINQYGFEEDFHATALERILDLRDFLKDKLVVYRPNIRGDYAYINDVRLVSKPLAHTDSTIYVPVPVFSQKEHRISFSEFLNKLKLGRFVGNIPFYEPDSTPPYILWRDDDDVDNPYKVLGEFSAHRLAFGGFCFSCDSLRQGQFDEEWFNHILEVPDNDALIFISTEAHRELCQAMENAPIVSTGPATVSTAVTVPQPTAEPASEEPPLPDSAAVLIPPQQDDSLDGTTDQEDASEAAEQPPADASDAPNTPSDGGEEQFFLAQLKQVAKHEGLLYDETDLVNFHTAMKTSNLVLLAGMSGTGKSKLVQVYGKALGLSEDQLSFIPVRPSWTDDADLIGYVDTMHMVYRPGDSGLINALREAEQNPEQIYIICFDEMNLARVEHYFAQFLSVLELEPARRTLQLYNGELENRLYNAAQYPPHIAIGDNVMFVGTVNLDESTYHFSDKVLDRANVITLKVLPFEGLRSLNHTGELATGRQAWTVSEYRSFKRHQGSFEMTEREAAFLRELHELLQATSKNLGIGFRIVRQMDSYLSNLPSNEVLNRSAAFDLQIVQRILTKLRGPEDQLKPLVGTLKTQDQPRDSQLLSLLDKYQDVSAFKTTRRIIIQKAKELKLYGYTV